MPRNGAGVASIPNSFTPATTISSSAVNANFSDLADMLTNSVAADGQTTITAALKGANGEAATPSYGFNADPDTDMYRKAANSLGFATGGTERAYIDSSGNTALLGTLDLGHASDTTISRVSAGVIAVEGSNVLLASGLGSITQAYDAGLADIAGLTPTDGNIIVGDGSNWVAESGSTARASLGVPESASQAQQETATATDVYISPGTQQFHPSAAKFWAYVTVSGGTPSLIASYNVTSIGDTGTGLLTVTIATDFSSANWACIAGITYDAAETTGLIAGVNNSGQAAGTVVIRCMQTGASASASEDDPAAYHVVGYGDQA